MKKKVYFTSLGCSKNLVDSQVMLGSLGQHHFEIVSEVNQADIIIVNTCSFIESAKKESIDVILEMAEYKKKSVGVCQILVVAGCMAQRYAGEVAAELPEVDLIIGTGEYHRIVELLEKLGKRDNKKKIEKIFVDVPTYIHHENDVRLNTSPFYTAWLKIAEGCDRLCTFCVIPQIRGKMRSRTVDSLAIEAQNLVDGGVRELNLIAQDLSVYGKDLGKNNNLMRLLDKLEKIEKLDWIRLLYYYPDEMSDEIIDRMASSPKICKYLDMPVQHFSDVVLKRMNRHVTSAHILDRIKAIRERIPNMAIRTSVIVGFPGETEDDFKLLLDGIKAAKFDHLGVFKYSDEEGAPASKLSGKVSQAVIEKRYEKIYKAQAQIIKKANKKYLGREIDVLIEGEHEETELLIQGRASFQAPDIDGKIIINEADGHKLEIGQMVRVKIDEVLEYDLVGKVVAVEAKK